MEENGTEAADSQTSPNTQLLPQAEKACAFCPAGGDLNGAWEIVRMAILRLRVEVRRPGLSGMAETPDGVTQTGLGCSFQKT